MKIITQIILNLFIIIPIIETKIKLYYFKNINDLESFIYFYLQLLNIFKYQIFQLICKNYFHYFYCLSYSLISNRMNRCILKIFKHLQYLCKNYQIVIRFKFRIDNHGFLVLSCFDLFYYCFGYIDNFIHFRFVSLPIWFGLYYFSLVWFILRVFI